jgi:Mn2+/Fe2+ NRAMP family transporter
VTDREVPAVQPGSGQAAPLAGSRFGPGLVFALTVVGPADILSNAAAGGTYGVSLLWAVALALVFRFAWVSTSAKYVLVTRESLAQGYARLGRWAPWVLLASLLVYRHAGNLYLVLVMGVAADLIVHLPTAWSSVIWSLVFVGLGFGILWWGRYASIETLFKGLAAALSLAFGAAAVLSGPDLSTIARGIFVPGLPPSAGLYGVLFVLMALIGTGSGSLTNMTYAYFVHRKGWRGAEYIRRQRVDLLLSLAGIFVVSACVQTAAAGTLAGGTVSSDLDELSRIFAQTVGRVGVLIFAAGLWAVSLSVFVGATSGFALIATDICRNVLPLRTAETSGAAASEGVERSRTYRGFVLYAVLSPLYILFTGVRPVWLVLFVTALTLVLVPLAAMGLLCLTNDRARMGRYVNGWLTNVLLGLLIVTALVLAGMNVFG